MHTRVRAGVAVLAARRRSIEGSLSARSLYFCTASELIQQLYIL